MTTNSKPEQHEHNSGCSVNCRKRIDSTKVHDPDKYKRVAERLANAAWTATGYSKVSSVLRPTYERILREEYPE